MHACIQKHVEKLGEMSSCKQCVIFIFFKIIASCFEPHTKRKLMFCGNTFAILFVAWCYRYRQMSSNSRQQQSIKLLVHSPIKFTVFSFPCIVYICLVLSTIFFKRPFGSLRNDTVLHWGVMYNTIQYCTHLWLYLLL